MTPSSYELAKEMGYLFASYLFCNKPQMKRLLSYLVHHCHDEGESAFDQRAIAMECLGRGGDFDPAENPVVRIEVGRLRRLLNRFYEEEDRSIKVTIPLGQYRPLIEEQLIATDRGYLPDLVATSAKPECLSLLLQFSTEGDESSELYLLRHQVRIGLTIDLGKIHGVRLVVALPDEHGSVGGSIDFVMRVVVSANPEGFQVAANILQGDTEQELFSQTQLLAEQYKTDSLHQLLGHWVSDYFDPQIGRLWPKWLGLRKSEASENNASVNCMVLYHQFQTNETKENLSSAMAAVKEGVKRFPGNKLLGFALADLYYRDVIHDFGVSSNSLIDGLSHIQEALRFDPGNPSLHTLLASLAFFSGEHDIAKMELLAIKESQEVSYFFSSKRAVLQCLMGEWELGINRIISITEQFGRLPVICLSLVYIDAAVSGRDLELDELRDKVFSANCQSNVFKCIEFMRSAPDDIVSANEYEALLARVRQHLEP